MVKITHFSNNDTSKMRKMMFGRQRRNQYERIIGNVVVGGGNNSMITRRHRRLGICCCTSATLVVAAAGFRALDLSSSSGVLFPSSLRVAFYHQTTTTTTSTSLSSVGSSRVKDILPVDLDDYIFLSNNNNDSGEAEPNDEETTILLGAVGAQLLLFGGWEKKKLEGASSTMKKWTRSSSSLPASQQLSLQERLQRITPTFKQGGYIDYSYSKGATNGIFGDLSLQQQLTAATAQRGIHNNMGDLADFLQDEIGLTVEDLLGNHYNDSTTTTNRKALNAMLTWKISSVPPTTSSTTTSATNNNNDDQPPPSPTLLLVFSFDATPNCYSVDDCPLPGPTNELLAATVKQFVLDHKKQQQHATNATAGMIHIIAQWEVAAALKKNIMILKSEDDDMVLSDSMMITAVGTPGQFQNTGEIFQLMLCKWNELLIEKQHPKTTAAAGPFSSSAFQDAILLAHPDHLRRVLWTSQTILRRKQQQQQQQQDLQSTPTSSSCPLEALLDTNIQPRLYTAMSPYSLDWPKAGGSKSSSSSYKLNLYKNVTSATVHTEGQELHNTNWYDPRHYGFFPDGDPQKWTHQRQVWILYDQWAVLKGIVTGTIDVDLI